VCCEKNEDDKFAHLCRGRSRGKSTERKGEGGNKGKSTELEFLKSLWRLGTEEE